MTTPPYRTVLRQEGIMRQYIFQHPLWNVENFPVENLRKIFTPHGLWKNV